MDQRSLKSKTVCSFFIRCYLDPGGFHYPDGKYGACLSVPRLTLKGQPGLQSPQMVWAEAWAEVSPLMPHLWQGSLEALVAHVQLFTLCFLSPSFRTGPLTANPFRQPLSSCLHHVAAISLQIKKN